MCGDCLYEISRENSDCVISTTVRGLNDGMLRSGSAPVSREETKRWGRRGGEGRGRDSRSSNDNERAPGSVCDGLIVSRKGYTFIV